MSATALILGVFSDQFSIRSIPFIGCCILLTGSSPLKFPKIQSFNLSCSFPRPILFGLVYVGWHLIWQRAIHLVLSLKMSGHKRTPGYLSLLFLAGRITVGLNPFFILWQTYSDLSRRVGICLPRASFT